MSVAQPYIGSAAGQFSIVPPLLPHKTGDWVLMSDLVYTDKTGHRHLCPRYFITDLASIPWLAQPIFSWVDARIAGIMHDWLYCANVLPRVQCDGLLREMLLVTGCDRLRASLIHRAVRVGGSGRYGACQGGPRCADFDWERMDLVQRAAYAAAYGLYASGPCG